MLSTAAGYRIVTGDGAEPTPTVEVDGVVYRGRGPHGLAVPRRHPDRVLRGPSDAAATV